MYRIIYIVIYLFTVKTQLCPTFGDKYPETRSTNIVGCFLIVSILTLTITTLDVLYFSAAIPTVNVRVF